MAAYTETARHVVPLLEMPCRAALSQGVGSAPLPGKPSLERA
jgi:hypothetical protein